MQTLNVEWNWQAKNIGKTFDLTQAWRYNTTLYEPNKQTREELGSLVLSRGEFLNDMKMSYYSVFSFLFLFRNNSIREQLDENDFHHC